MASFRFRRGSWRAEIAICGNRLSKTFREKKEAEKWASETEELLRTGAIKSLRQKQSLPKISVASSLKLTADHVLKTSHRFLQITGVYFLIRDEAIIYIGQSTDIFARLSKHRRSGRKFDRYAFIECRPTLLDDLEHYCILKHSPPGNHDYMGKIVTPRMRQTPTDRIKNNNLK